MIIRIFASVVAFVIGFSLTQFFINFQRELDLCNFEVDTQEYRVDSIRSEMFVLETELNRYQIALEMLEDENHQAASEFNKRLSMTE